MSAVVHRVQPLAGRHHAAQFPPVALPQGQRRRRRDGGGQTALGVHLAKSGGDGGDVAAVAVEPVDALEAVSAQGIAPVADRGDHGAGAQGQSAGEAEVVLRAAHGKGRADKNVRVVLRRRFGNDGRADGVGADQAARAVLFHGTDGHDQAAAFVEIGFDIAPGGQAQQHGQLLNLSQSYRQRAGNSIAVRRAAAVGLSPGRETAAGAVARTGRPRRAVRDACRSPPGGRHPARRCGRRFPRWTDDAR